jgi:anti-anti-sigma factor
MITLTVHTDVVVASVTGELDAVAVGPLRSRLGEALRNTRSALILDLTGVSVCSAAILQVLLDITAAADAAGVSCAIVSERRAVLRPIELAGLGAVLRTVPTLAAARGHLGTAVERAAS